MGWRKGAKNRRAITMTACLCVPRPVHPENPILASGGATRTRLVIPYANSAHGSGRRWMTRTRQVVTDP